ncbi:MAG TPA: DUF2283 domain-containing protein [Pirellulales bacterium]
MALQAAKREMEKYSFAVTVEANDRTGQIMAVYLRFRKGKSAKTKERVEGSVFADYDRQGRLLGIEVLEPCPIGALERIVRQAAPRRFVRASIPGGMLAPA